MKYYVYLARCSDGSLYVGSCKDVTAREKKHNKGEGAQYTRQRLPIVIVYSEEYEDMVSARRREIQIKKRTRIKKENLIRYSHPTKF